MPNLKSKKNIVVLGSRNIHYVVVKLIILLLLSTTSLKAHYDIPKHTEITFMDYDLRICSKGELESHFFKREKDPDYILGIYTGSNLNLNCLKEQFQKKVQNYPKEYLNDSSIKVSHDISYYKSYITNYDRVICGESCYLDEDSILFVDDKFWYIYDLYNSYGHKANFVQTLDNKIHIELNEVTHTKNILFDTKHNTFSYLYDGKLNFHEGYYIAKYTKNYFKNGGAFWYSAMRDYNNNIIKLLDLKTNFTDCKDVENYSLTGGLYEFILTSNNLQFCKGR